jgi:hypothetical protein
MTILIFKVNSLNVFLTGAAVYSNFGLERIFSDLYLKPGQLSKSWSKLTSNFVSCKTKYHFSVRITCFTRHFLFARPRQRFNVAILIVIILVSWV